MKKVLIKTINGEIFHWSVDDDRELDVVATFIWGWDGEGYCQLKDDAGDTCCVSCRQIVSIKFA